jgi:ABC-type uncharacterized transport system permease subunit
MVPGMESMSVARTVATVFSSTPEFRHGALAALRWLLAGGPAPLTGTVTGQPPAAAAVVRVGPVRNRYAAVTYSTVSSVTG